MNIEKRIIVFSICILSVLVIGLGFKITALADEKSISQGDLLRIEDIKYRVEHITDTEIKLSDEVGNYIIYGIKQNEWLYYENMSFEDLPSRQINKGTYIKEVPELYLAVKATQHMLKPIKLMMGMSFTVGTVSFIVGAFMILMSIFKTSYGYRGLITMITACFYVSIVSYSFIIMAILVT